MASEIDRLRVVIEPGRRWVVTYDGRGCAVVDEATRDAWLDGTLPEARLSEDDARGIAALRNVAPALIAVVEAADVGGCTSACEVRQPYRGCTCGHAALRAALDALDARIREALGAGDG